MEVYGIIQEAEIKTIPKKKKCKKAKWLSQEALQIAEKRKEAKYKGEKERYTHLNAKFQRTAKRDKKAFLSDQCKEIEENNRMGKTRDLFKKIRDNKGTFHAKMGTMEQYSAIKWNKTESFVETWRDIESIIQSEVNQKNKYLLLMHIYGIRNMAKMSSIKDRNDMDLTEAKDIKKRWQEYIEELNKKRSSQPR